MVVKTAPGVSRESPIPQDLPRLARLARGMKPAWSHQGEDLNLNLISCTAGQGVDRHLNSEVEVVMIGIDGDGSVELNGIWHALGPGQMVIVPKGAQRATRCDGDHFAYLTCHRSRPGLWPTDHRDGSSIPRGGQS